MGVFFFSFPHGEIFVNQKKYSRDMDGFYTKTFAWMTASSFWSFEVSSNPQAFPNSQIRPFKIHCRSIPKGSVFFFPREGGRESWGRKGVWRGGGNRRERILSRLHAHHGARCRAQSHNPEIMTWAKVKSWTLNQLSHSGILGKSLYRGLYALNILVIMKNSVTSSVRKGLLGETELEVQHTLWC